MYLGLALDGDGKAAGAGYSICDKCGGQGYRRTGIGFDHEFRCGSCGESWDPNESSPEPTGLPTASRRSGKGETMSDKCGHLIGMAISYGGIDGGHSVR